MTHKRAAPVAGAVGVDTAGPMALWDIPAINADPVQCGLSGSPTKVKHINSVVLTAADIKYIEPTEAGITELIHGLIADHTFG
jgi:electron transfer flavoprotein beta subunit